MTRTVATGGLLVLGIGAALLALALAFFLVADDGGGRSPAPAAVSADLVTTTSAEIAFWEERLAADPADFTAADRLASAYIQRGRESGDVSDFTRAQAAVNASFASFSDNPAAFGLLATLQNVRHEFAAAIVSAERSLELDPTQDHLLSAIGDAQVGLGLYAEAFDNYTSLTDQAPSLAAFSRLAYVYELRGDLANAEGAWGNALSLDSGSNAEASAWANTQYATFRLNQGDLDDAATPYDAALDSFPGYIHALAGQARVAAANGDYDSAIALYTQVTERQPLPEYVAALGDVYAVAGQTAEAAEQYALVEAIRQLYVANGINTDLQIAVFLADHDLRLDEALASAEAVYAETPGNIYAADALAWALYKNGRAGDALPYAEEALRLATQGASLWYHSGLIHAATGDEASARAHLQTAIDINPHFSPLQAPIAEQTLAELGG
ncbi:MAG TPA: tetratricopeptide repeat protein [Dehalococcoidia bacterium]|nr:tetratricopeptide repeat protein [Dehalococcoidia bacterium]